MTFKIGDRVRVVSKEKIQGMRNNSLYGGYGDEMPRYAGKEYTIDYVSNESRYHPHIGYRFRETRQYVWDERLLELVKPKVELPEDLFKL